MRVLLASGHRYPGDDGRSSGRHPRATPSGAPEFVHDSLARGLAELGHEVFYLLEGGAGEPLPPGVLAVTAPPAKADVWHNLPSPTAPWVRTGHGTLRGGADHCEHYIFVSHTLAARYGGDRVVYNGVDPADYLYADGKDDYLLFISSMDRYLDKGLDVALRLAATMGFPLTVVGTGGDGGVISEVSARCAEVGARYVGDARGLWKAELLAGARALLFPTRAPEGFGLVLAEALMSGTPVIASDRGACPEIITPEVGFVCRGEEDYIAAVERLSEISPRACRQRAERNFHYLGMAAGYVREYGREISAHRG